MKNLILIAVFFLSLQCFSQSNEIQLRLINVTDSTYQFSICNNLSDSVYFFNTYFKKYYDGYGYTSKYFRRYDKKNSIFKLSLIPLVNQIWPKGMGNDRIVFSKNRVIISGQEFYEFEKIAPHDSLIIDIHKEAFTSYSYIKDFHAENASLLYSKFPKLKDVELKGMPKDIILELAIYKKIDNLMKWANNVKLKDFADEASNFQILTTLVHIQ